MDVKVTKTIPHQREETTLAAADGQEDDEMPIKTPKSKKSLEDMPDRMARARAAKLNQSPKASKRCRDMRNHPKVLARSAQMPEIYRSNYSRAMSGKSPAAGIKAHCLMCVGWQREEVKQCTAPACPFFPYRPYQD